MKASPGRLMQSSVTAWSLKIGRRARRVRSSAEISCTAGGRRAAASSGREACQDSGLSTGFSGAKLINAPKVEIARDQHLDAIAVCLGHGRRNIDRGLQHLGHDVARGGRAVDDGSAV